MVAAVDLSPQLNTRAASSSIQHHWYHWRAVEAPPRHPIAARSRGSEEEFRSSTHRCAQLRERRRRLRGRPRHHRGSKRSPRYDNSTYSIGSYDVIERWRRLTIFGLFMGTNLQRDTEQSESASRQRAMARTTVTASDAQPKDKEQSRRSIWGSQTQPTLKTGRPQRSRGAWMGI